MRGHPPLAWGLAADLVVECQTDDRRPSRAHAAPARRRAHAGVEEVRKGGFVSGFFEGGLEDADAYITADDEWSDRDDGCPPELDHAVQLGAINAAQLVGTPSLVLPEPRTKSYYDVRENRAVFTLQVWHGEADATIAGHEVVVRGAGGDERVPLSP